MHPYKTLVLISMGGAIVTYANPQVVLTGSSLIGIGFAILVYKFGKARLGKVSRQIFGDLCQNTRLEVSLIYKRRRVTIDCSARWIIVCIIWCYWDLASRGSIDNISY